jgi:hypothetical protein
MALAKPTIATNWGGQLDFMTRDNSFLIELDGLVEVPVDSVYGWQPGKKWALPSVRSAAALMGFVAGHRAAAARVGRRARRDVVARFDDDVVADVVEAQLRRIRDAVRRRWRSNGEG